MTRFSRLVARAVGFFRLWRRVLYQKPWEMPKTKLRERLNSGTDLVSPWILACPWLYLIPKVTMVDIFNLPQYVWPNVFTH